jgi:hypothetical protein
MSDSLMWAVPSACLTAADAIPHGWSGDEGMTVVCAKIHVAPDGTISGKAPREVPPGEYQAPITQPKRKRAPRSLDLPLHEGHWDDRVSLRREDIYGDDGR